MSQFFDVLFSFLVSFYFSFFSVLSIVQQRKVFNFYQKISWAAAVFNEIFALSCKGLDSIEICIIFCQPFLICDLRQSSECP